MFYIKYPTNWANEKAQSLWRNVEWIQTCKKSWKKVIDTPLLYFSTLSRNLLSQKIMMLRCIRSFFAICRFDVPTRDTCSPQGSAFSFYPLFWFWKFFVQYYLLNVSFTHRCRQMEKYRTICILFGIHFLHTHVWCWFYKKNIMFSHEYFQDCWHRILE